MKIVFKLMKIQKKMINYIVRGEKMIKHGLEKINIENPIDKNILTVKKKI